VYRTAPGERKVITLANRTTMILAPATTARITASGIELSGQAWFDVRSSERDPFIVRTASSEVRVLGTSFSVRQYPAELHARVAVVEGKVGMRLLGPATQQPRRVPEFVVLTARMAGESSDSGIVQSRGLSADEASAWTRGRLVFRQASLRDVAAELSRAYGADIRVNDTTLSSQRVTLTAQLETQTVAQVLDLLAQALDARCVRTGKAFVLTAGRAPRQLPRAKPLSTPETQYGR
jgi:ferric-dicitrate binding protein FerR (iron transport regulator)